MNKTIEDLMYQSGLTADGCWNEMDAYDRGAIERLIDLVVKDCIGIVENLSPGYQDYRNQIEDAFRNDCVSELKHRYGVEE
jgi:hypothetical protein